MILIKHNYLFCMDKVLSYQKTIGRPISMEGLGLYSQVFSTVILYPAKEDSGIVFYRKDLEGLPIPALIDFVIPSKASTTLGLSKLHCVRTVEHLMAFLKMINITNLKVDIYGPELPISDGSALIWKQMFSIAGIKTQNRVIRSSYIKKDIYLYTNSSHITVYSNPAFAVISTMKGYENRMLAKCNFTYTYILSNKCTLSLIASRTFATPKQVLQLRSIGFFSEEHFNKGLIYSGTKWLNGPLRFISEPMKHKILDTVGDFSLASSLWYIKIVTYETYHALSSEILKVLNMYF
uniref:UDP-3-O-acyl-N-acetylglucosamine deacetylase n=1 Tax=Gronococcus sybilensis TaxID=3028029 RepID=A0A9Y1I2G7_9RHOD|nr:UDP-3-0-acyl N-acetylglucosamine deacetylase [Gronococcus sybilensis]